MKKGELINLVLVAVLAFACGVTSFLLYGKPESQAAGAWTSAGPAEWQRNDRDQVVLLAGTDASVTWDETTDILTVNLVSGGLLWATEAGDMSVVISTAFARVDSQKSTGFARLNAETGQLELFAENHPHSLTFLKDGRDLNVLSVPSGHKVKVSASKVSSTLEKLRLAKLSKEFPIILYETEELDKEIQDLFADARNDYTQSSVDFLSELSKDQDLGPPSEGFGATLSKISRKIRSLMTLLPQAKENWKEDQNEKSLQFALSNAQLGELEVAETWLTAWRKGLPQIEEVQSLRSSLFFVLPGDDLYAVKSALNEPAFYEDEILASLQGRYREIESLLQEADYVQAELAYRNYQNEFESALAQGNFDESEDLDEINREYFLIELLLRSHAIFYTVDSTNLLEELESQILSLAGTEQDLDEERLAFVQSRIRFLTNLFEFVYERRVSVDDGTDLANELIFQAEEYMNSIVAEVAVSSYFEEKLAEFRLSVDFINSPEFRSFDSFQEGLLAFEQKAKDLDALNQYIQSLRSGEELDGADLSLEDATAQVKTALFSNGIQYVDVLSLGDAELRLFSIQGGYTAGHEFQANYDRETGLLYDVVSGEIRFSTGIELSAFSDVLSEAYKEEVIVEGEGPEVAEGSEDSSYSESAALSYAKSRFEEAGLEPEGFEITLLDLEENLFAFEGLMTGSELEVSATLDADTDDVSEIVWVYEGESHVLADTDLSQLEEELEEAVADLT